MSSYAQSIFIYDVVSPFFYDWPTFFYFVLLVLLNR